VSFVVCVLVHQVLGFFSPCGQMSPYNGTVKLSVNRPEGTREFYVHVPAGYNNTEPIPLIMAYHGWLNHCENLANCKDGTCGLAAAADAQGFILVYACGWNHSWNAGTCCAPANILGINDHKFSLAIIALLQAGLCIDPDRVFAAGFSNGAMLSEVFICNQWNVFSAAASVSGVVEISPGGSSGLAKCNQDYQSSPRNMSVLNIHGNADPVVPWDGDPLLGYPAIPDDFSNWAQRNKCTGPPVQTFKKGPYSNQVYQNCSGNAQVELVKHDLGGHMWPQDQYFDSTQYLLEFFQRISGWVPWTANRN